LIGQPILRTFTDICALYALHPEMIGLEIDRPDTPGAVDDALLHLAARRGSVADVADLIRLGATIDLKGDMGFTALHYAAMHGHDAVAALLLTLGADRNVLNEFGQTALEVALLGEHQGIADLLRKKGP
jgi:ankyrin repeat protein